MNVLGASPPEKGRIRKIKSDNSLRMGKNMTDINRNKQWQRDKKKFKLQVLFLRPRLIQGVAVLHTITAYKQN